MKINLDFFLTVYDLYKAVAVGTPRRIEILNEYLQNIWEEYRTCNDEMVILNIGDDYSHNPFILNTACRLFTKIQFGKSQGS